MCGCQAALQYLPLCACARVCACMRFSGGGLGAERPARLRQLRDRSPATQWACLGCHPGAPILPTPPILPSPFSQGDTAGLFLLHPAGGAGLPLPQGAPEQAQQHPLRRACCRPSCQRGDPKGRGPAGGGGAPGEGGRAAGPALPGVACCMCTECSVTFASAEVAPPAGHRAAHPTTPCSTASCAPMPLHARQCRRRCPLLRTLRPLPTLWPSAHLRRR